MSGRGHCASFWADDLQGQEYVWKVIMKILSLQPWLEACRPTGLVMLSCRLVDSLYQAVMQNSFFQWADANWYAESCYPYARWLDTSRDPARALCYAASHQLDAGYIANHRRDVCHSGVSRAYSRKQSPPRAPTCSSSCTLTSEY